MHIKSLHSVNSFSLRFKAILLVLSVLLSATSCNEEDKIESEINEIPMEVKIERFESDLKNAKVGDIPTLKKKYPFLVPTAGNDSTLLAIQKDTLQQDLFREVEQQFAEVDDLEEDITRLFQHIKYYDPTFTAPRVITTTSFVDYRNKNIVTDSVVLIALDTYLGSDHEFYANIPKYITQNMNDDNIISDLAASFAKEFTYQSERKTLLDEIVYFGKQLYFKDKVIPFRTDANRIGYKDDQISWAKANEFMIWQHFIDKEMLYSTDNSLPNRFIAPAPFSKFYLELDAQAPGRLGQFIGWQMVRSYMENNDTPLLRMMEMETEQIFKDSKYKPKK